MQPRKQCDNDGFYLQELQDIRKAGLKSFREIVVDEQNILQWQGLIVPDAPPFSKGAFKIDIQFPVSKEDLRSFRIIRSWHLTSLSLSLSF